jgi:hypothetical protein
MRSWFPPELVSVAGILGQEEDGLRHCESPARLRSQKSEVGKANRSRECAPDDRLRVPTFTSATKKVGTALSRLCPPYAIVVIA